ncbi:MAG: acetylxylan esterase, partial [Bacteroidales bacterium]|nr:acetylxylan esterase [Bacteroidales bacterium]
FFINKPEIVEGFIEYLHSTAALIKSIDPKHMVSTGSEGFFGCEQDWDITEKVFDSPDIDYITAHIWPYNWSWVREDTIDSGVQTAIDKTDEYIDGHLRLASKLGKPVVIEEFGYPRDGFKFSKDLPVNGRNNYYEYVFGRVADSAKEGGFLAGCNFWAWGGLAEQNPESDWYQEGDDFCGDPPQEQQGLNSVYYSDTKTVQIIKEANDKISKAVRVTVSEPLDWLKNGDRPGSINIKADSPSSEFVTVNIDLVKDLSLMSEVKDTVLSKSTTIKSLDSYTFNISGLEPGFYQVNISYDAKGEKGSIEPFNIGFNPEDIESPQDKQPDFDAFWESTLSELAKVPMNLSMKVDQSHTNDLRTTYIVEAKSLGGVKMGGILCVPNKDGKYPVYIDYMGYGADVYSYDPSGNPNAIEFLVSVRDQGIFRDEKKMWIDRGLSRKEDFYYRGAFCDVVRAIDIVAGLDKTDSSRIFARGESQGGAFTLISASLDSRIAAAAPAVPFLGDYRDYSKIVWWPVWEVFEAADAEGIDREDLFTTLSYFDVKNFTDRIKCPVYMAFGLQDPTCPPHTNFSEYNMISSPKSYYCGVHTGHGMWQVKEWSDKRAEWFKQFEK